MLIPQTRYAKRPDGNVAYQVLGDGPIDLIFIPDPASNLEIMWEDPALAQFLRRLATFSRLICYDKLGTGLSDRLSRVNYTLDIFLDDVPAVMAAAGSQKAAVFGHAEGGLIAMLLAASFPDKVSSVILADTAARRTRAPDYEWGIPEHFFEHYTQYYLKGFGTGDWVDIVAPSRAADSAFRSWHARYLRFSMGPGDAEASWRGVLLGNDLRPVLPSIRQKSLVMHHAGNRYMRVGNGRYLGKHLPNARYLELPGDDHVYYAGDMDAMLNEVQEFLTGEREAAQVDDRVLATVLFTDIVGSTERAVELGDSRWREVLESYYRVARREISRHRGVEVDTAGDGFFATFDGPARAIRCACVIRDAMAGLGVQVRAGLHTGECERIGEKVGGIAVHIGSRVAGQAGAGEVLVSSTVKDLVAGSRLEFDARGPQQLKGLPGEWQLFAVN